MFKPPRMKSISKIGKIKKIRTIKSKPIRKAAPAKPKPSGSHIEHHEYNEKTKELTVAFRGGRKYRYAHVPKDIADGLAKAGSKGSFMRGSVIGKFGSTKI